MIKANDPTRISWVQYDGSTDFPVQNIPFGIMIAGGKHKVCSRIGDYIIDIAALYELGFLNGIDLGLQHLENEFLNDFISLGKEVTNAVRDRLADVLDDKNTLGAKAKSEKFLRPALETVMSMPVRIGDYTDFYSSREHAFNVGCMFRDPKNALMPNWLHLPVGYHGRASSIILSDCDVKRPKGQQLPPDSEVPVFGPCKQLDFELEVAFIVGKSNHLGETISTANAEEYIFGLCLFNDWSARDIQRWEYVPLGPFLS
ncbi:MAG TPA: fumarylacetoacetate hydrolase family protein, partial [Saprospiraceae bacterium]|nr:fumarylacetoacetate hydrolase family protein [Saprospiraceae bacterium]